MLMYFTGYDSVRFTTYCPAKKSPTGIAWGLMHIPVMYGSDRHWSEFKLGIFADRLWPGLLRTLHPELQPVVLDVLRIW